MTEIYRRRELNHILKDLGDELDVPPSKYEDAKNRYEAVGAWLNEDDSEIAIYRPEIYPQGSFALGTAVRPLDDEDYDVDSVCLLQINRNRITQRHLKQLVGNRLNAHKTYARMIDPKEGGRRCWTLKYADDSKFHLDILPAIPDEYDWLIAMGVPEELAKHAICITDKETWNTDRDWPRSNPNGYVDWFKGCMRIILEERRRSIALEKRADVSQIPDYEIKTPLQRVIQLLKRHRDMMYNDDDDKPISIIITTLAAQAYNNEDDILDALLNIVPGMRSGIENRNGTLWVLNPVNPQENFADKWAEEPRKKDIFYEWLYAVEQQHHKLLTDSGFAKVGSYLTESYGQRDASAIMAKYANRTRREKSARAGSGLSVVESTVPSRFNVAHREGPKWPIIPQYGVKISARASRKGFQTINLNNGSRALPKNFSLRFEAHTDTPRPYEVYWQTVNTGDEARRNGDLRGKIVVGDLVHTESTLYEGMHWIECFIVKARECVAHSGEFVVNIK